MCASCAFDIVVTLCNVSLYLFLSISQEGRHYVFKILVKAAVDVLYTCRFLDFASFKHCSWTWRIPYFFLGFLGMPLVLGEGVGVVGCYFIFVYLGVGSINTFILMSQFF